MDTLKDIIIVAGPVIIEDNKVLLDREIKFNDAESPFFMFPGGKLISLDETPEQACIREAKEELGIDIEILRPLKTVVTKRPDVAEAWAVLIHFLARRTGEPTLQKNKTVEFGWFDIHDLPKNCTQNVAEVIEAHLNEKI
ncbi:MAG: hypothetical protein A3J66_03915 [Candidatus Magasanikbacteria bacterium RIFCSPHIGHO2_02_FULL_47_14]|uniref:Nudix hydrolase domain-containing protein n=1 Tax=Candidatus Magasanikbacteria bacterium RIFCSPHIGHO2_02_FULL_47_14 TaxID=1798680 RepID=A0A1F6M7E2_9BACT|nr:MAG: hypothetical protein A3J66_03915 [Candidatus Magasanikbacteria bacterium RIFCSPHIGHO2_02_FULL_47_14]